MPKKQLGTGDERNRDLRIEHKELPVLPWNSEVGARIALGECVRGCKHCTFGAQAAVLEFPPATARAWVTATSFHGILRPMAGSDARGAKRSRGAGGSVKRGPLQCVSAPAE